MKHIILSVSFSFSILMGLVLSNGKISFGFDSNSAAAASPASAVYAQVLDSLTLVTIYNATGGPGWTNSWDLSMPVCDWVPNVVLNSNGNVVELSLNNNNLIGTIPPDISNLAPTLTKLQLDNNCLSGSIPSEIGNCTLLQTLFLDDNKLTGPIPTSFGQLTSLITLFLDNNELTGMVPIEFLNMSTLQNIDIFNNCFDSIPDLTAMIALQPNKFKVYNNKLTFDDLLPNQVEIGTFYEPQDSFGVPITVCLPTGRDTFIDLGIDAGVTSNTYQWYKDGVAHATTTVNKLFFSPVDWSDAGVYNADVTNSIMTDLTLNGRPITVKVVCGESFNYINDTYCSGSGDSVVVGITVFNEMNPSGSVTVSELDQYGCDSTVVVDLTYYDSPAMVIDTILCPGESVTVNGEVYDEAQPTGIENLGGIAQFGCDSTIEINVTYYPQIIPDLTPTICLEDTFFVYDNAYYLGNEMGTDTIEGVAFHGCDSIVNVNVNFYSLALEVFDDVLCTGGSMNINGTDYDAANPSDTIVIENGSQLTGCDSVIYVDLSFGPGVEITIDDMLCNGDSLVVGSTTFNQANPSGSVGFPAGNASECDTTVFIDLSFYVPDTGFYNPMVCQGGSVEFNGTTYDGSMPSGMETISSQLHPACDSIVEVQLTFTTPPSSTIDTTLCPGESISVNGEEYDESQPTGIEVVSAPGPTDCDSTINVNVSFYPEAINPIDTTLCEGASVEINGTTYDASNPTDTIVLGGTSFHGCDSIIVINLSFFPEAVLNIDTTICSDASVVIEGEVFDMVTPNGSFTSGTSSFQGCDSTINVTVNFFPLAVNMVFDTLCFGESMMFDNTTYDASNPTDTIVLGGASFHQCDSMIYIDLEFYPEATGDYTATLCPGDSVVINNTVYNEGNTSGVETFPLQSFYMCDSTLNVTIDFYPLAENTIDTTLCFGDELTIAGMNFGASNAVDTVVLSGITANGCDSTIFINLNFYPEAFELIDPVLCFGQSLEVNGVIYDEMTPMGMDTIFGGSFHGCDSILQIDLTFNSAVEHTIDDMLCIGDSVIVDTVVYDVNNPTGADTILMGSYLGCDSIIIIDLQFPAGEAENTIDGIYCPDYSVEVNGFVYDIDTPTGEQVLMGSSSFGCDSTVFIDLEFYPEAEMTIDTVLCPGGSLMVGGETFDASNPNGEVLLEGASFHTCDSTIYVNVQFHAPAINDFSPIWCEGQSIEIEGEIYDIDNPTDTVVLSSPSFFGCDSIVHININFSDAVEVTLDSLFCPGEFLIVNNTTYDEMMPTGTDTIQNGSYLGCDSIIHVNLSYYSEAELTFLLEETICPEDTIFVNGTAYHQGNPTGTEIITGESYTTCDSTVNINLSFYPLALFEFNETLCPGESVTINGVVYDMDFPSGMDVIPGGSFYSCDSLIDVNLSFYPMLMGQEAPTLCMGENIEINGTLYDEDNTMGSDTLFGMSYTGCDSVVQVQVSFYMVAEGNLTASICEGEAFELNGMSYDVAGSYSTTLQGGSFQGCDSTVNLELTVLSAEDIGLADAGIDQNICDDEAVLSANLPAGTTGVWTNLEGAVIDDPTDANSMVFDLIEDNYTFVWTLSNAVCSDYSTDTVTILVNANPEANDDIYQGEPGITLFEMGLLDNDFLNGVTDWIIEIPNPPLGDLTDLGDGNYSYDADPSLLGTNVTFEYLLCNENCITCDTALVVLNLLEPSTEFPNAITPNGDGKNDVFVIPFLEEDPDQFITRELIIFNRWGDIVYQAKPYLNDWGGTNQSGQELPQGTYYYKFRLVLADGKIYNGDITILK